MSVTFVNGDNPVVLPAIDMVTSTKETSVGKLDVKLLMSGGDLKDTRSSSGGVEMTAEGGASNLAEELAKLKDFFVINLTMMQQQSELLATKDKELAEVKHENELLWQQLDRVQRRVALTEKASPSASASSSLSSNAQAPNGVVLTVQSTSRAPAPGTLPPRSEPSTGRRTVTASEVTAAKRIRRKVSIDHHPPVPSPPVDDSAVSPASGSGPAVAPPAGSSSMAAQKKPLKRGRRVTNRSERESVAVKVETPEEMILKKLARLETTTKTYFTAAGEIQSSVPATDPCRSGKPSTQTLEVPSWRIKPYHSTYTMEGTENLSDEVFVKRHSRLVASERKRKKWDVQRIREQRAIEKLREKEEQRRRAESSSNSANAADSITSFWPSPAALNNELTLVVTDQLPYGVFGINIPRLPPFTELTLPWKQGESTEVVPFKNKKKNTKR